MNWSSLQQIGIELRENALLSAFTTFRIGGPCPCVVTCASSDQLALAVAELAKAQTDFSLIGGGSNLLVSDAGVDAVVVRYCSETPGIRREGDHLDVEGGTLLDDLALYSVRHGLDGLVHASGIPGTVGGGIAGNAGAFGKQIGDAVEFVQLLDRRGRRRIAEARELAFRYRSSRLHETGDIVVSARLRLHPGDRAQLQRQRDDILEQRRQKHPDWRTQPTAGSFFRNIEPTSAAGRRQAAGWFLEQAGAKEMRVGGARVFEKHANIIVAEPGCTAQDVLDLSRRMAAAVKEKFGLILVPEVRLLGRFA
ncbi:MAG: UDP-N-acetylmuramate dehydrogenase [Verrucomicrobiota bacterium]